MSYYALVENDVVTNVIVAEQDFIDSGAAGTGWVQTFTDGSRGRIADIGLNYDAEANFFYGESPFPSWTLNKTTFTWEAPTPYPNDGKDYRWKEDTKVWQEHKYKGLSFGLQSI